MRIRLERGGTMDKMLIPQWKRLARDLWQSERTLVISCFAKEVLKKYCTYPKKTTHFFPANLAEAMQERPNIGIHPH
jgi:hypothetical protein